MAHSEQLPNPLNVLCDTGVSLTNAQSIVTEVESITLSQKALKS